MDADQGREMVEGNYVKLFEAWDIVESKHDLYTMYLTDEELEVAERWITELQDLFAEATALKIQYIQNSVRSEVVARETTLRHESEMKERAERERKAEKALIMRTKTQTVFDTICNNTKHFLDNNIASHTLERSLKQIEDAYTECKNANDDVLDLADRDTAENAIKFAAQIQCRLDDMTEKLTSRIGPKDDQVARRETCTSTNFQLEKIKLPRFEGEIRAYPQFKRDFEKQIMPHLQSDNRAVYTRENKPRLALAAAYVSRERNYLYEYKLPGQDKPRLEKAVNVDFVPFIRGVRGLRRPLPVLAAAYFLSYKRP